MTDSYSIAELYKAISTGNKVTLELADKAAFNTIRVALCQKHRTPKALDLIDGSICAAFNDATGAAVFYVGERKNARKKFIIVKQENLDDSQIRGIMGEDSSSPTR